MINPLFQWNYRNTGNLLKSNYYHITFMIIFTVFNVLRIKFTLIMAINKKE